MTAFIGKPLSRRDGPAKVMGEATYAAEFQSSGLVHAVLVPAAIASGRASVDAGAAEQAPGVLRILTAGSFPRLDLEKVGSPPLGQKLMPLQDDRVLYQGQAIALVIAETLEQAEEAARLVQSKIRGNSAASLRIWRSAFAPRGHEPGAARGNVRRHRRGVGRSRCHG